MTCMYISDNLGSTLSDKSWLCGVLHKNGFTTLISVVQRSKVLKNFGKEF